MNPERAPAPLFGVCLELVEPEVVFTPSLDFESDDPKAFINIVTRILEDIISMGSLVPRVSKFITDLDYKVIDVSFDINFSKFFRIYYFLRIIYYSAINIIIII